MMRLTEGVSVYQCRKTVGLRKSIDGLSAAVERVLGLDPLEEVSFVFADRRKDKIKVPYWERSGFVLLYKRLEKARFPWPAFYGAATLVLSGRELDWILDGTDFSRTQPHETLQYRSAA
ncbi:MAG: IS66 family insertion sequence element accessory protein TnpB [bacterium]|nr:IS66 family insertion sequence element accessory protein TnpB [bacterium]